MVDAGAQCVYVVDSAGALVLADAQERIKALIDEIGAEAQVGFHGHQNLCLGIANSVLAYQAGALQIDGALCALGAGAGNSPTEVLAATFERMGIRTGVDLGEVLAAAEDVVRPFIPRWPWMDRASITQGYAGVYSSFLLHAERAAARYDVPAHEILTKVGEAGYVGGQEDMIIDIALQLSQAGPQRGRRQEEGPAMTDTFFGHVIDSEEVPSLDGARSTSGTRGPVRCARRPRRARPRTRPRRRECPQGLRRGPVAADGRAERAALIHRLADLMEERADDLATLDATNMGKPFQQAKHDVARSVANFRFFADHQRDSVGEAYPMDSGHHTYSEFGPGRCGGRDLPVELPADDGHLEGRPGDRVGQHLRDQAVRGHPGIGDPARPARRRGRLPARRAQRAQRARRPAGSSLTADDRVDRVTFTGSSVTGKA